MNFLIFQERFIQNPDTFRTQGIFRTLSNIYDQTFCKNSYLVHFLIFCETVLVYISKNGTFQPYISGSNFPSSKSKKNPLLKCFLYFEKWNFLAPSLKNLYFRKELAVNQKFLIFLFEHNQKRKKFLIPFLMNKRNFLN